MKLTDKYRPRSLVDIVGQPHVVQALTRIAASPSECALLLAGYTGSGKSSAAMALAEALGCIVEQAEFGGLWKIPSGEQTADTVRALSRRLWQVPMMGKGWKVVIVNECDSMSPAAQMVWLDLLEHIPPHTVFVFTTNDVAKLSDRFRDRCQEFAFNSSVESVKVAAQELVKRICAAEGLGDPPKEAFTRIVRDGHISFRRCVQAVESYAMSQVAA